MEPEEACDFAKHLSAAADRLEAKYGSRKRKPNGARWFGTWSKKRKRWGSGQHSTFEEAIASIREAASWYEKVGHMGCSVHAWY